VQSKTQKGPQQPREKKKGKGKKGSGGNDKKDNKNVEGEKNEKRKVKFPCNSFVGMITLLINASKMEESQCLIKLQQQQQQPVVLKNCFRKDKICRLALPRPICKGALQVHLCQMDIFSFVNMVNHMKLEESRLVDQIL
jgi:hypothetical protein